MPRSIGKVFGGKSYAAARAGRGWLPVDNIVVFRSPPIPFSDLIHVGAFFSKLKFGVLLFQSGIRIARIVPKNAHL